jgi:hypothetical protein
LTWRGLSRAVPWRGWRGRSSPCSVRVCETHGSTGRCAQRLAAAGAAPGAAPGAGAAPAAPIFADLALRLRDRKEEEEEEEEEEGIHRDVERGR